MKRRLAVREPGKVRGTARIALWCAAFCLVALFPASTPVLAQQLPNLTSDQYQQILQNQGSNPQNSAAPQPPQTIQPAAKPAAQLKTSRIEQIMSARAGAKLKQFGYDQVGIGQPVTISQTGAVSDNYVLGPGDQIVVSLRGQENNEYRTTVDRNGQVVLPRLNPIMAAGRKLGDFREDLKAAVSKAYISTEAFVSIGNLRQISVMVSGEVANPGMRIVTGLTSPLDAILLSGGVKKTGSLRNIKVMRDGKAINVDLYTVLTQQGQAKPVLLTDGDRIIVPPLGPTVAAVGWMRRPGIYELPAGATGISVRGLIAMAGGLEVRGRYRLSLLRVHSNGASGMEELRGQSGTVRDSEVLFALPSAQKTEQQAVLSGGTPLAGQYSIGKATTLATLLESPGALGETPYTLFGIISRRNPSTQLRSLLAFSPVAVVNKTENMDLVSGDLVRVFSVNEARLISAVVASFRKRRELAQEQLRTPDIMAQKFQRQLQLANQNSNNNNDQLQGNQANQNRTQNNENQRNGFNFNQSEGPHTERQDIAELSLAKLGPGGILVEPGQQGYFQLTHQSGDQQNDYTPNQTGAGGTQNSYAQLQNGKTQQNDYQPGNGNTAKYKIPAQNLQEQETSAGQIPTNQEVKTFGHLAKQLNTDPLVLIHFLMDNEVSIDGAVRGPGNYIVGPTVTLKDLVAAAGGTAGWADMSNVELISTSVSPANGASHTERKLLSMEQASVSNYVIKPYDEIRFSRVYASVGAGSVIIEGQVRSPGNYKIERGERLSELLLRAGGLTDVAYPYGTVFLRKSAANIERQGYERTADEVENMMVAGLTRVGNEKTSPDAFTALQSFVNELRTTKPLGRISMIADPALLAANPSRDPLLESGDVIFIPQRPSTVAVLGQVLRPGNFAFSSKNSVKDYIALAGGPGQFAESGLTFIIYPDGTAKRVETSWLDLSSPDIPPGSTIVVPRDVAPIDTRQIILDAFNVMQSLAVSAASLAVISR